MSNIKALITIELSIAERNGHAYNSWVQEDPIQTFHIVIIGYLYEVHVLSSNSLIILCILY